MKVFIGIRNALIPSLLLWVLIIYGCATASGIIQKVCNPTPEEQATAQKMLAAIDAAQAVAGVFVPGAEIVKASTVLRGIISGGCFIVSELTDAFKVVDQAHVVLAEKDNAKRVMRGGKSLPVVVPEYAPLRKYVR